MQCAENKDRNSVTLKPFKIFTGTWCTYKAPSDDLLRRRTITPQIILTDYATPKFLVGKSCPLNNSETHWDIFVKLDTNVKHDQMMCRDLEL